MAKATAAPLTLPEVLENSLKGATWLTSADDAAVQIARILAKELSATEDVREIVSLSKQLNDQLQSLGMNIAGRTGKAEAERETSPLDAIKARSQIRLADSKAVKPKPVATKSRTRSSGTGKRAANAVAPVAGTRTQRGSKDQAG